MERLLVREGEPVSFDPATAQLVRRRMAALQADLRPRIGFLSGSGSQVTFTNVIGSVQVTPNLVIDVEPKTAPGQDWAASVIDLVVDERIDLGGQTPSAQTIARPLLVDAIARLYATQLEQAVRRDGPLSVIVRESASLQKLTGRLDVSAWVTSQLVSPAEFPQQRSVLTVDNDFARAMTWVAEALAMRAVDPQLASRLRRIAALLRPGLAPHAYVDPRVAERDVPPQWRAYVPAWATACAVLRRLSPLHRTGVLDGLNLAIEPWPLLERLLLRSLRSAARQAALHGLALVARGHSTAPILRAEPIGADVGLARLARNRFVEPDGSLWSGGQIVANFEAKYSRADSDAAFRSHVFQVMATAAALGSPMAVLVYPEASEPVMWTVAGFGGRPVRLAAVGLDMFSYRRGEGDACRGEVLLNLIEPLVPAQQAQFTAI